MNIPTPPNTFYRFRSIDALLDKYQELENETIYFASPEELNDPMEGLRDIVWRGDKIVWEKFFKHYIYCFHQGLLQSFVAGDSEKLTAQDIPILDIWDQLIPKAQGVFDDTWNRFLDLPNMPEIIEALSNSSRKIRYRELRYHLQLMHQSVLNAIIESYIAHNILPESERPEPIKESLVQAFFKEILTSIMQNEEAKTEEELQADFLKLEAMADNNIIHMHQDNLDAPEILRQNFQLVFYNFPATYLGEIGTLLWPNWYAACFMKSYHNSSAWGHYGGQHKGACLIFESVKTENYTGLNLSQGPGKDAEEKRFFEVDYVDKPDQIDFFNSISYLPEEDLKRLWYTNARGNISECFLPDSESQGQQYLHAFYRGITVKTKDWEYEKEYRLILPDPSADFDDANERKLSYDFHSLKGIIFGINTSYEHKARIAEIILKKCEQHDRTDFKFYQAYYSPENGDIRKYEIYSRRSRAVLRLTQQD